MPDLSYALRTLIRQPLFTLIAVLTLAIGIGANTAIFSLVYQTLLRPLPYPESDRLVFVWNSYPRGGLAQASVSIPDYLDRRSQAQAIADATLFAPLAMNLSSAGPPDRLRALRVTPSFFTTLRRVPALGRAFAEAEATPGSDRVVILTHGTWQSRLGGDPSVIGRELRLNAEPYTIVGVLPVDFELPSTDIALLVPFAFTPAQTSDRERGNEFSAMIARLAPGATRDELESQMRAIVAQTVDRIPERRAMVEASGFTGIAVPLRDQLVGDVRAPLALLQAGVLVVLLIACANVANLLLMRATGRQRELALRITLGASRRRIARQLVVEGLVLAGIGAACGLALGYASLGWLVRSMANTTPVLGGAALHPPVLAFTVVLTALTGLVFGLVPALTLAFDRANTALKDDSGRATGGRSTGSARAALVVVEAALALVLLVGAGLLVKSFVRLQQVDPGFSTEAVLTAQLTLPDARYADAPARAAFWERLLDRVRALPGVSAVGLASNLPFSGAVSSGTYRIVGFEPTAGETLPHGRQEVVGGDFFTALGIPLVRGRTFTASDTADAAPVVVVDEFLVQRYFKDRDPIGQQIRRGGATSPVITIVGVVGSIRATDLAEPITKERLYYPAMQQPLRTLALVVHTEGEPIALAPALRSVVAALDPEQPVAEFRTMNQWVSRSLEGRRSPMILLVLFGAVALALSAIGLYGVLAFAVTQRVREIGIRLALGAEPAGILRLVLRQGLRTTGIGILIGLSASLALTRYLHSQLYGVEPNDLAVIAVATALLLLVAVAACSVPARRATHVDPVKALRSET